MNKSINKDNISNQAKINRKKAIDIILFGGSSKNRSVNNIIESMSQQNFEMSILKNKMSKTPITFREIYKCLNSYKKGMIPLIIALFVKENIKYMVVQDQIDEITINSDLLNKDFEDLCSITLRVVKNISIYDEYKELFYLYNESKNIFSNIVDGVYKWFFSLNSYSINISKEYVGCGNYKLLPREIIEFKDSLKIIQKNPYWFLSVKIPKILGEDFLQKLQNIKSNIENSLPRLKKYILSDIKSIFPEGVKEWYENLSEKSKKTIYTNNERKFFLLCLNDSINDEFIEKSAVLLTGLPLEYWNDATPKIFYDKLLKLRDLIEENENKKIDTGFVIKYIEKGKEKYEKILNARSTVDSTTENMIINEINAVLNDYRNCINNFEKVSIALKLVLEECERVDIS